MGVLEVEGGGGGQTGFLFSTYKINGGGRGGAIGSLLSS